MSAHAHRRARARRAVLSRPEALEARLLLHAGISDDPDLHVLELDDLELIGGDPVTDGLLTQGPVPISSVPILNSLLGAAATVYLDFNGHFEANWGSFANISTPVYDTDGNATTFSDGEQAAIRSIWSYVAEDFAPFNVNVTTVEPPSFANGAALRVSIGGNGNWLGANAGGVAYVNSFTNSIVNTVYVFSKNLANGYAKYVGEASSHEAGHAFGLQHQSKYSGTSLVSQYSNGTGDGRAPIMGNSYSAARGLWWHGTTTTSSTYQDDMSVIARQANGFGYRQDDHGNTVATATPLTLIGSQFTATGIITTTADVDAFSFTTAAGQITLTVGVPTSVNNLDAKLELRDSNGQLIASAAPSNSFGATITTTVAAGSYRLIVASNGNYGDVGQYTVSGTVIPGTTTLAAPGGFSASVAGQAVTLAWADVSGETGYEIERSTDGQTWVSVANTPAGTTSWQDTAAVTGGTYLYRVRAVSDLAVSQYSGAASVTLAPSAPATLVANGVSASRINLQWSDVFGESGYRVERSVNGTVWTIIATVGEGVTSLADTNLASSTTYLYRVTAINAGGESAHSVLAAASTLAVPSVPNSPSNLHAVASGSRQVELTWKDNSNNENYFRIVRSINGRRIAVVAYVRADATRFVDTSVRPRTRYAYQVQALNENGSSAFSNVAEATTAAQISARRAARLQARQARHARAPVSDGEEHTSSDVIAGQPNPDSPSLQFSRREVREFRLEQGSSFEAALALNGTANPADLPGTGKFLEPETLDGLFATDWT